MFVFKLRLFLDLYGVERVRKLKIEQLTKTGFKVNQCFKWKSMY